MAYQLKTFGDMVNAVREELKIGSTDTVALNRIKRDINIVYSEIVGLKRWWWLIESTTLQLPAFYGTSHTCQVFTGSSKVTASSVIGTNKTGYLFSVEGDSTIYRIESHTAGSAEFRLSERFAGASSLTAGFKIWTDHIPLPANCKETVEVMVSQNRAPLENLGHQEWRKLSSSQQKRQGVPEAYYTSDFIDPFPSTSIPSLPAVFAVKSDGVLKSVQFAATVPASVIAGAHIKVSGANQPSYNGEHYISRVLTTTVANDTIVYTGKEEYTEAFVPDAGISVAFTNTTTNSARYRALYLFPAINTSRLVLHVDYTKQVKDLDADSDEPIIPKDDRMILVYGALHRAWSRERNPEEAGRNLQLYTAKFGNMAGQIQDSLDKPIFKPSRLYLSAKRNSFRNRRFNLALDGFFESTGGSTGGSVVSVLGSPNTVAIFNADGELEGSSVVNTTELSYLDGASSNLQTQLNTINSTISSAFVTNALVSPTAAIARSKLASGTASKVVVNDGSGVMSESAVNSTELSFLSGVTPLTSVVLANNQVAAADAILIPAANTFCFVIYSILRNTSYEGGMMVLLNDGSTADLSIDSGFIGVNGITLSADVSGGNVRVRYTSTNTGFTSTLKYAVIKWAA